MKFLLHDQAELINTLQSNSQREVLMNRLPNVVMPIGCKKFNTKT